MSARIALGVVVGLAGILIASWSELLVRGLQQGAIVGIDGELVRLVGPGFTWVAGVVVLVVAVVATRLSGRSQRSMWGAAATTALVFLIAGSAVGGSSEGAPVPTLWLQTAASSALAWALAGIALGLALRRPRNIEDATVTQT